MKHPVLLLLIAILNPLVAVHPAEVVSVRALSSKILMVHIDDGSIIQHSIGESPNQDIAEVDPLNIELAVLLSNYSLSSSTDPNYAEGQEPIDIGRKSKGTEFADICQGWDYIPVLDAFGCVNEDPDHAKEHWLYLFLPFALVPGNTYDLNLSALSINQENSFFDYVPSQTHSEAVHVNQIGYVDSAPEKYGYVYSWLGDKGSMDLSEYSGNEFHLIDESSGEEVFSGGLTFRKDAFSIETAQENQTPNDNFLGAEVYECDFSSFSVAGTYTLYVEGIGSSFPFEIGEDVLRKPFQYVMQGIYQNRSGIALEGAYVQDRPAPHNVLVTPGFAGRLKYTNTTWCEVSAVDADPIDTELWEAGYVGELTETWGWYQDAGDWDAYLRHMEIPSYLFFLYDHFPENFSDGELEIPESGNGLPDILDEARWLIRFYKRLKDELIEKNWGSGGIGGARIFPDLWGTDLAPDGTGQGSWQDVQRDWYVSGEDPFLTYWYAGCAAHFAKILEDNGWNDPEGINWELEAQQAYIWANENSNSTGNCHDHRIEELRMYAAASLYRLTTEENYHNQFLNDFGDSDITSDYNELTGEEALGVWQYCNLPSEANPSVDVLNDCLASVESTATFQLLFSALEDRACRWGGNFWQNMLTGQATTPHINEGIMGFALLRETNPELAAEYKTVMHNTADYFLGNNPLNMTWITGLGERTPLGIFHLDSWYSSSGGIRRGIVPYGPWRSEYGGTYGPYRNEWAATTTYPDFESFPGHERWFDQRVSPLVCEFTVDRTNLYSAFLYGALAGTNPPIPSNISTSLIESSIQLIPNPAKNQVVLDMAEIGQAKSIRLHSTDGQLLKTFKANSITLNIEGLSSGVYLVEVVFNKGAKQTMRLVVL